MKRITLSAVSLVLLGAASAAHAQNSVTLYGAIDDSIQYIHNATPTGSNQVGMAQGTTGNLTGSRWGLKGSEDLGAGLKAIFKLENGFNPNTGKLGQGGRLFGRQSYFGLSSDTYGTFTMGRQYDPLVDMVQSITADNIFSSMFSTPGDVDNNDNSSRTNNSVKYVSPSFSGLQAEAMYAFGGVAGQTGSGQTWSGALAYNNGPLSLAGGYFVADNPSVSGATRTTWGGTSDGTFNGSLINLGYQTAKSINIGSLAAQYVAGLFTFGVGYSNAQYKADAQSAFGSTEKFNTGQGFVYYQATRPLLLALGYSFTKSSGDTSATYNQVSVGADYNLSKRTDLYLLGAWQHASGNTRATDGSLVSAQASVGSYGVPGTDTQAIVSLGLRHKF